jgi:hypothetical protein
VEKLLLPLCFSAKKGVGKKEKRLFSTMNYY